MPGPSFASVGVPAAEILVLVFFPLSAAPRGKFSTWQKSKTSRLGAYGKAEGSKTVSVARVESLQVCRQRLGVVGRVMAFECVDLPDFGQLIEFAVISSLSI